MPPTSLEDLATQMEALHRHVSAHTPAARPTPPLDRENIFYHLLTPLLVVALVVAAKYADLPEDLVQWTVVMLVGGDAAKFGARRVGKAVEKRNAR